MSNSFGSLFRITTFGESHGKGIGVVIDGCPSGVPVNEEIIFQELKKRSPGYSPFTSPRKEADYPEILSGVLEGKTTGMPLAIFVRNQGSESHPYQTIQHLFRPSHANFTYLHKYGVFDGAGGGRASGRETVARVAAAAVAKQLLAHLKVEFMTYISQIGHLSISKVEKDHLQQSALFCPDPLIEPSLKVFLDQVISVGDSVGGVVECRVQGLPIGLGEPIYDKLEAKLAMAMLSIPGTRGFEIGSGFAAASMRGSEHNDPFINDGGKIRPLTNHAGGVLAGISTGEELIFKVAFKPTSSIKIAQQTVDFEGQPSTFNIPQEGKHDPCIAIRAVPVVEAMCALVLADLYLSSRLAKL